MTEHDRLASTRFLEEIQYCDQTASPPKNARQTNALLFHFVHHAPNQDRVSYQGLLIYSPPVATGSELYPRLGSFNGTGAVWSTQEGPPRWVRIRILISQSRQVDPATDLHRYFFTGGVTILEHFQTNVGGPGFVQQEFECDFELTSTGAPPHQTEVFMQLINAPPGHTGEIFYKQSTVVP
jgi:hypothetical protein